ncbi:MAG: protein kinase [Chitinivibrionales bacterium]|nr:protein kinase [Chitinivibrionales bacterium]
MAIAPDSSSGWQSAESGPLSAEAGHPQTRDGAAPVTRAPLELYEILRLLGKGGMGEVYLAYEPLMHRCVALKVLRNSAGNGELESRIARFLAEAMLTGRLTHGGIIPIYQVGFDPAYGYYYSMRYVKGYTLQHILKVRAAESTTNDRSYSLPRLLEIFVRVCEAVAHAHRNGILHRDLKPSNVMLTESNEVLVLDWGLAKDLHTHDPIDEIRRRGRGGELAERCSTRNEAMTQAFLARGESQGANVAQSVSGPLTDQLYPLDELTQSGILVGTPWYMSPEQISGERSLNPASDVYALGVILYRLLSGGMPVESRNLTELVSRVSRGDIERIETRPEALRLPKALCDIVNRSLALEPDERYGDAGLLADDIRLYLEGQTPLRLLVSSDFGGPQAEAASTVAELWAPGEAQPPELTPDGAVLTEGMVLRSKRRSLGDFRCRIGFRARRAPWAIGILIGEEGDNDEFQCHHEIRLGVTDRAFAELRWMRRRMQRRFDVRLQAGQYYQLAVEVEDGYVRVRLDDSLVLNYRDIFPQTGGMVALAARGGTILVRSVEWHSRGAPLNLSYQFLPDRYFLAGRFREARQLYIQMADSHPDREEGLMALYKSGLCSAELRQTQEAFESFSRLENTMLDHYCTLGLARIGILDGNIDWAWEALKSGHLRHKDPDVRTEIWFALLDVIEQLREDQYRERAKKYLELLKELEAAPQELRQIIFEYLDLIGRKAGSMPLRRESARLLQEHPENISVAGEALCSLWRTGLDETAAAIAYSALEHLDFEKYEDDSRSARLLLLRAELEIAQLHFDEALDCLRRAVRLAEHTSRSERLWAMNWVLLCRYMKNELKETLQDGRETLSLMDQYSTNQLAYLLHIVALVLLRSGRTELAKEALGKAGACTGWWGTVAAALLRSAPPDDLMKEPVNGNLSSEALFMAGEVNLRMGKPVLARAFFTSCDQHPSRRVMTRRLARVRLREMAKNGSSAATLHEQTGHG